MAFDREGGEVACGPVCLNLIQGVPAGIVAAIATLIGALIARQQNAVAAAKLKLDLFEKRYPIFMETWKIMSEPFKITPEQNYGDPFSKFIPQARFLFGEQVEQYLQDAARKWRALSDLESRRPSTGETARRIAEGKTELRAWFNAQEGGGVQQLFAPYLDFEKWK